MLERLLVSNLAIVEKADVEFSRGLNVLTGETGSGKSVIMGAVALVLGARADSSALREGEGDSKVEAVFDVSDKAKEVNGVLAEAGLPECDGGELIIRRVLLATGSGKVWVNDSRTTLSTLKSLSAHLVDIHGARANQNLLEEFFQRYALDSCGRIDLSSYSKVWEELASKRAEIDELLASQASEDELDMLRYQVSELEGAHLTLDDEDLKERHAAAAHAGEILEIATAISDVLGDDGGVADSLIRLQPRFNQLGRFFSEASEWASEAEDITVKVQELSRTIAGAMSKIEADPAELDALDQRLSVINRLMRKYLKGGTNSVSQLLEVAEAKSRRLKALEDFENTLATLRKEEAALLALVEAEGAKITRLRTAAGAKLARLVTQQLKDLGFLQAKFYISLEPSKASSHGMDSVSFMFEPNPGESARKLADIASSGEIARVMLALKSVLAMNDGPGTVVFDEIDANIGGDVARAVGEKMRLVGERRQVIAITHQPQSAVFAANHLVVSKAVVKGRTLTSVRRIEGDERVSEIARMLGGGTKRSIVCEHARELLEGAGN